MNAEDQAEMESLFGSSKGSVRVAKEVTSTDLKNFQRLFAAYDPDNTGYLEFSELKVLLGVLGYTLEDEEMTKIQEKFDADENGRLDFDEFVNVMLFLPCLSDLKFVSLEEERAHIMSKERFRFYVDQPVRWVWDTIILIITQYYTIRVVNEYHSPSDLSQQSIGFEAFATMVFFADIFVRMNTAFQSRDGSFHEDFKVCALNYLRSWFAIELLGALPLDLCFIAAHDSNYCEDAAFRVLRSMRILRFARIIFTIYQYQEAAFLHPRYVWFIYKVAPLLRGLNIAVTIVNLLSAIWLAIRDDSQYQYYDALYVVLYTLSTVGLGDVPNNSAADRAYATFLCFCAIVVNGLVISQISSYVQAASIERSRTEVMRKTLAVLQHFDIPSHVQSEILSFQAHIQRNNLGQAHEELIKALPQGVQDELTLYVRIKYISMVPMFRNAAHDAKSHLANALSRDVHRPGEFIVLAGEKGSAMFFLSHGVADVVAPSGAWVATLRKGSFFGEIALVVPSARRTASVKALTYCDVFILGREKFLRILKTFPLFREQVREEMESRIKQFKTQRVSEKDLPRRRSLDGAGNMSRMMSLRTNSVRYPTAAKGDGLESTRIKRSSIAASERGPSRAPSYARLRGSSKALLPGSIQADASSEGSEERDDSSPLQIALRAGSLPNPPAIQLCGTECEPPVGVIGNEDAVLEQLSDRLNSIETKIMTRKRNSFDDD